MRAEIVVRLERLRQERQKAAGWPFISSAAHFYFSSPGRGSVQILTDFTSKLVSSVKAT